MIRVLLVDGQTVVRKGLRALLSAHPDLVVVGEADHSAELGHLLPSGAADVVVLDGDLLGLDGPATVRQLRAQYPQVQILALSGQGEMEEIVPLLAAGVRGCLRKQARLEELVHGIRTVAAGHVFLCSAIGWAALHQLHAGNQPLPAPENPVGLTKRETQVLQLLALGLTSAEMAERLFVSTRTVETHRQRILAKTQTKNTATLIKYALSQRLVT